jgi:hypothetical protein
MHYYLVMVGQTSFHNKVIAIHEKDLGLTYWVDKQ